MRWTPSPENYGQLKIPKRRAKVVSLILDFLHALVHPVKNRRTDTRVQVGSLDQGGSEVLLIVPIFD